MKNWKRMLSVLVTGMLLPLGALAAGAIAVDDEEGETEPGYGFVVGADSREEAGKQAMKECKKSGNTECKVVVRFDTCGAYAASKKYYGVGWGGTKEKAISMAMGKCEGKCRVVIADCE